MIHPAYNLFLAVYLAHLFTDFVLQTKKLVSEKHHGRWHGYVIHGIMHYIAVLAIVAIADPHRFLTLSFQLIAVSLSIIHLLVDWAKVYLTTRRMLGHRLGFVLDQIVHLGTVILAVLLLIHPPIQAWHLWLMRIRLQQEKILLALVVYVFVIFCGGYLIRELISPLWREASDQESKEHAEVANAGLYIGWLERFLVLTALLLQSPATVGLILTAKSIARYPELKSVRFAEYFLIGTLLSLSLAIAGSIILLWAFYGTAALGK